MMEEVPPKRGRGRPLDPNANYRRIAQIIAARTPDGIMDLGNGYLLEETRHMPVAKTRTRMYAIICPDGERIDLGRMIDRRHVVGVALSKSKRHAAGKPLEQPRITRQERIERERHNRDRKVSLMIRAGDRQYLKRVGQGDATRGIKILIKRDREQSLEGPRPPREKRRRRRPQPEPQPEPQTQSPPRRPIYTERF